MFDLWSLHVGTWMFITGYVVLDFGSCYWILAIVSWIFDIWRAILDLGPGLGLGSCLSLVLLS